MIIHTHATPSLEDGRDCVLRSVFDMKKKWKGQRIIEKNRNTKDAKLNYNSKISR